MGTWFKYSIIGLAGGVVGGLMGVGGGIIMIPLLTLTGIDQKRAQGTSLLATLGVALVGMVTYGMKDHLSIMTALPLALGGVVGAYVGAGLVKRCPSRALYRLFGIALLAIAIRHVYTYFFTPPSTVSPENITILLVLLTGIVGGVFSGFFGLGGGVIFVPAGVQLLGLAEKTAQGVSLAAMIPTVLMGGIRYFSSGNYENNAVWPVITGAAIGSLGSSLIATNLQDKYLAVGFGVLLAIIGLQRLLGGYPKRQM